MTAGKASARDRNFMIQAAQGGMAEVQMSQLALKKTNNTRVRDFAQMMVRDHSDLNGKLTPMATQLGVSLPTQMSAADTATLSRLRRQSGAAFDRSYMAAQKAAHNKTLALFQDAGAQANDPNLRNSSLRTRKPSQPTWKCSSKATISGPFVHQTFIFSLRGGWPGVQKALSHAGSIG